jgi:hypothetical protein
MSKLSRRSIVAGAAAIPALAVSAAAPAIPDPAFAAIDRLWAARKAHEVVCEQEPGDCHSPLWAEWNVGSDAACSAEWNAMEAMVQTRPTTKAGARALIAAHLKHQRDEVSGHSNTDEIDEMLLRSLAEAIPHLA